MSSTAPWQPDPDIRRAETPPADFYFDGALQRLTLERVFGPSWQWIADAADLEQEGQVLPLTLLGGALNEPLVLTRSGGERRCLSNVCTHRALLVAEQPGIARSLRCRYHGRRFDLDGRFVSAPGFEEALNFPGAKDDLCALRLKQRGPWLFTSLRSSQSFEAWWGPLDERLSFLPWERALHDPARDRTFVIEAHWALYVENYLEGLHIPFIHPALSGTLEFETYVQILLPAGSLQVAYSKPGEAAFDVLPKAHPEYPKSVAAFYFWLFPNLMINAYPWGFSINLVKPIGPARWEVLFRSYVLQPELLGRGAGGDLDLVEREDEQAVESVQRGLLSRLYRTGRYAPQHEQGTHHFHRLWSTALSPRG